MATRETRIARWIHVGVIPVVGLLLGGCGNSRTPADEGKDPAPAFTDDQRATLSALSPDALPPPPSDVSNRFADDAKAAALGQRLFFDASWSGKLLDSDNDGSSSALGRKGDTGKVACAGCHLPGSAFTDTRTLRQQISLAAGWGRRKAPSLLDVGQSKLLMWDGRFDDLYSQIFGVIENAVEANSSRLYVAYQIFASHRAEYEALFGDMPAFDDAKRFPPLAASDNGCQQLNDVNACSAPAQRGAPGDGAEYDGLTPDDQGAVTQVVVNAGKAIGAYERLLSCGTSRFDAWQHGDVSALSHSEQRGAALFIGKARCVDCHSGPFFSDEKFHNVGMKAQVVATVFFNPNDPGAAAGFPLVEANPLNVKGTFSDGDDGRTPQGDPAPQLQGAFRTPRLRCGSKHPSFMHTGQMKALDDVVTFFDRGGDMGGFVGKSELQPLGLSAAERGDLTAFLSALEGPGPGPDLLAAP